MEVNVGNVATISGKEKTENGKVDETVAESKSAGTSLDDALTLTETGCFHYTILLCGGIVFLACGFQNGLNAYILPSCKCDFDLTSAQMGLLNALFLVGGISSGYLNGALADSLGRRLSMIISLLCDSVCSILCIFAPNFLVFASLRFASGFVIGGPAAIVFLYLSEYLPIARRAPYMLLVGFFWTLSWLLLPALAWIIIPAQWPLTLPVPISPWRIFVAIMAVPSLVSAFFVWKMPETPSYLYSKGRTQEALDILTEIFVRNTAKSSAEYPVKILQEPPGKSEGIPASKSAALTAIRLMKSQMGVLFTPPVLSRMLTSICAIFSNMFTFYGLALWLPELLSRFQAHYALFPDRTVSMCELTRIWPDELAEVAAALNSTGNFAEVDSQAACNKAAVNPDVFMQTLIISAVTCVANVGSALIASKLGRKTMPVILNFASSALVVAVYFMDSTISVLIIASLFQAAMSTGNTALNGLLVDIFPSRVSALGVTTGVLAGRVGAAFSNIALGTLIDIQCEVPLLLLAVVVGVCGLLCCFFPDPYDESKESSKTNKARRRSISAAAA